MPNKVKDENQKIIDVRTKIKALSDKISEQDLEVTCVFCGLTNKYMRFYGNEFNNYQRKMNFMYVNYNYNASTYG